jgi:hypothetical protein
MPERFIGIANSSFNGKPTRFRPLIGAGYYVETQTIHSGQFDPHATPSGNGRYLRI